MLRLRSRQQCAINGFQFIDAPISHEPIVEWDFNSCVAKVISRRQNNPRFALTTDVVAVGNEVDFQNALRMQSIRNAESYIIDTGGGGQPNFPTARNVRPSVAGRFKSVGAGVKVLLDWIGEGAEAVQLPQSERRASICAACPMNQPGGLESWFTEPASALIRKQLSIKNDLNLSTSHDDQLNVCSACLCPLRLKVHVPIRHVLSHLPAPARQKLVPQCWILAEEKELTSPNG